MSDHDNLMKSDNANEEEDDNQVDLVMSEPRYKHEDLAEEQAK
jgi:hypothetical protein